MTTFADIDFASGAALHRQVYVSLRAAILSGRLAAGARLPATRVLAQQLSVSRSTVSDAYDQLQSEGYIEGRHGSGTYVAPNLPEDRTSGRGPAASNSGAAAGTRSYSRWGENVIRSAASGTGAGTEGEHFEYDFRPHRVAQDMFPWDAWRAGIDRALTNNRDALFYAPAAGHPALQETIARHIAKHRGVVCTPDQIVIVNGTQQGLNLLADLLLEEGERVAVEDPGYPAARLAWEARGLEITRIPVDAEGIMVDEFVKRGPFRLVHVTPSHQDPTGATLSLPRRLALLDAARRTGCVVLEDDYDSEFRYEGRPVESLQGLDNAGLVVYAGTFSKSVLAGLRIGFVVLPSHLVGPFVAAKSTWDSGAPMLEQLALVEFMRSGMFEKHIRRMRRVYRARRDALVDSLKSTFGESIHIGERHGGLNVLVRFDVSFAAGELAERARADGIGLRTASSYYEHSLDGVTLLMGFAAIPEQTIADGVAALARCMRNR